MFLHLDKKDEGFRKGIFSSLMFSAETVFVGVQKMKYLLGEQHFT